MLVVHRDIVGGFIFSNDNHILLGESRAGGGIEKGETMQAAVAREILEEVGIDITSIVGTVMEQVNNTHTGESEKVLRDTGERVLVKMHFYDFAIKIPQPAASIDVTTNDDLTNASWISLADLAGVQLTPPTQKTLQKLGHL